MKLEKKAIVKLLSLLLAVALFGIAQLNPELNELKEENQRLVDEVWHLNQELMKEDHR